MQVFDTYSFKRKIHLGSHHLVPTAQRTCLQDGSLEQFLSKLGVPEDQVDATVQAAIVWRVTPAGRPLIDRRRRSRVERNVHSVTEHLINECNLSKGD